MSIKVWVLLVAVQLSHQFPNPAKLRRVPKIYNALITTKQKLLPSEAYPASTGQVFEPIGLTGDPVLLNPEAFAKKEDTEEAGEDFAAPEMPRPFAPSAETKAKMPAPVVFYPKYSVYQPYQPVVPYGYPYQQPLVYTPFGDPVVKPLQPERSDATPAPPPPQPEPEEEEAPEEVYEQPEPSLPLPPGPSSAVDYVKNNRPSNSDIPDVPPPPPPVGAPKPQMERPVEN